MADEVDFLGPGCLEHLVDEVGHKRCGGVDVAAGLSSFHERMRLGIVIEL